MLLASWTAVAGWGPGDEGVLPAAAAAAGEQSTNSYLFYIDVRDGAVGGDGTITTREPQDSSESKSAFDGITFHSPTMYSNLYIKATPLGSEVNGVRLWLYTRFDGPAQNATANFRVELQVGTQTISDASFELKDCGSQFVGGCDFENIPIELPFSDNSVQVNRGERLTIVITAEADCQTGSQFLVSCSAEVAWGHLSGKQRYSHLELPHASVLGDSALRLHRPGSKWVDAEVIDWYPNDVPDRREMQFSVDIRDSFGRDDIDTVTLVISPPRGSNVTHEFQNSELRLDNDGLVGSWNWTYSPDSVPAGDYEVSLDVSDLQGNRVIIKHDGFSMLRWGVTLTPERDQEFIAPSMLTTSTIAIRHTGAGGDNVMHVELSLLNSLGTDWRIVFDRPAGYQLSTGGSVANAQLTIEAPEFFSGDERRLEIIARAKNVSGEVVQRVELKLDLVKIGVHEAPQVSIFREETHAYGTEVANSTHPDRYLGSALFVEADGTRDAWMDVFNTGFDDDRFRVRVADSPDSVSVRLLDNETGQPLPEDDGGFAVLTETLARHTVQVIRLRLGGVDDRALEADGVLKLRVTSVGNASKFAEINITVHRTYGVRIEAVDDDDGAPYGHLEDVRPGVPISMRLRITDSRSNGTVLQTWRLRDPGTMEENTDRDSSYGAWSYAFSRLDGSTANPLRLAPGESVDVYLEITTESGATAGNHTVYVRVEEADDEVADEDMRYFDLSASVEVGADLPTLRIVQQTPNRPIAPKESRQIQLDVENRGNSPATARVEVDAPDGWTIALDDDGRYISVEPFGKTSIFISVIPPANARHGDTGVLVVVAEPFDLSEPVEDGHEASTTVRLDVEHTGFASRVVAEVMQPRAETVLGGAGVVLVITFAVWRRRRRGGDWEEEPCDDEEDDPASADLPEPVTEDAPAASATASQDHDDGDIELIAPPDDEDEDELLLE